LNAHADWEETKCVTPPKMVMTSGITKYLKHTCYTFSYTHTSA